MPPAKLQQLLQEAVAHHGAGRLDQAEKLYRAARAAQPRHFDVLHLSGTLALQQGRHAEAIEWLGRALPLNPRSGVCAMRLAVAQSAVGRLAEAEENLRLATRRQPDLPEAWDNLGYVLKAVGRLVESIPCYERAVALKPDYVAGWYNLGLALQHAGRLTDSLAAADRALALSPHQAKLHYGRALALQQCHRIDEAVAAYDAALARDPAHRNARSYRLMALNYSNRLSPGQLFAEHRIYGAAFPAPAAPAAIAEDAPGRKLRVAFLSPDLRTHSVAYFLEPLLRKLDRTRFEVLLYHDHFTVDEVSSRLHALASVWRNFVGQSHDAVEPIIRADAPDILIDLAGHTGMNRLPLFARRVAPVQISYLGYPNTTGLTAMDYRFTDAIADPVGEADAFHTEHLVRFAPTAWAYQAPADCPPVAPAPCLASGHVTFGSFNNFSKVSDETLAAWGRLLRAVPHSRLRLKTSGLNEPAVAAAVRGRLRQLDIAEERIELLERTPDVASHLALYHGVDIALDTHPYHGTTTTCEALWMGVPVVTLAGDRHASRVGASLLGALGRPKWIARDWSDYTAIAARLAGNPAALGAIRAGLRGEMQRSPLCDHAGQAARFGAALQECWQAVRARRNPALAVA